MSPSPPVPRVDFTLCGSQQGGRRNDFDTAIANSVPVPRDKNQLSSIPAASGKSTTTSRANAAQSLEISITSTSDKTAAELAAEQAKKQMQAEKNALPVWHTQSTVDPSAITTAGAKEAAEKEARALDGIGIAARTREEEEKKAAAAEGTNGVQADGTIAYPACIFSANRYTKLNPQLLRSTMLRWPHRKRRRRKKNRMRKMTTMMKKRKKMHLRMLMWLTATLPLPQLLLPSRFSQ